MTVSQTYVDDLVDRITTGKIPFPYIKTLYGSEETAFKASNAIFENLKNYQVKYSNVPFAKVDSADLKYFTPPRFRGQPVTIVGAGDTDYMNVDILTNFFTEEERLKTKKVYNPQLPLEWWKSKEGARIVVTEALKLAATQNRNVNTKDLRDSFAANYQKEVSNYKLTWIKGNIELYYPTPIQPQSSQVNPKPGSAGKRYLDISAGWGDRLITAIAMECEYLGFDPNINLKPGHDQIIKRFGDPKKHRVIYQPFEQADLSKEEKFDFCLTSPPFFDIEIYPGENQSITTFPDFYDWFVGFLFKSFNIVWNALKVGGYLGINISDVGSKKVVEPMLLYMEQFLPNSSWIGTICKFTPDWRTEQKTGVKQGPLTGKEHISAVWTWQKVASTDDIVYWMPDKFNRTLANEYPELFARVLLAEQIGYISSALPDVYKKMISDISKIYSVVKSSLTDSDQQIFNKAFKSISVIVPIYTSAGYDNALDWFQKYVKFIVDGLK